LFWTVGFALGFAVGVVGMKIIEWDKRKLNMDIEEILRSGGSHWLYCADCERWWYSRMVYCRRCDSELEVPAKEILVEFCAELTDFWCELQRVTAYRNYEVKKPYSENEVAGLLWTKKRHEAKLGKLSQ